MYPEVPQPSANGNLSADILQSRAFLTWNDEQDVRFKFKGGIALLEWGLVYHAAMHQI